MLSARERDRIIEIDRALERIDQGNYGICTACGFEITEPRLQAMPFTHHCRDCQQDQEREAKTRYRGNDIASERSNDLASNLPIEEINRESMKRQENEKNTQVCPRRWYCNRADRCLFRAGWYRLARVNGVVVNGNTTTVFEAADHRDLQMHLLTQWSSFAQDHQNIAHQLTVRPTLINNAGYLQKHPDLEKLFSENPDLRTAMNRDPGNYLANLPQSEE